MKVRKILVGIAAAALVLGMRTAARNLSDSQMAEVWGGDYCDVKCNLYEWGCIDPYSYTCHWEGEEPNQTCEGVHDLGDCDTASEKCWGDISPGWTCSDGTTNGEDCALNDFWTASCHWIWYNDTCDTIWPDDFSTIHCNGDFEECYDYN